MGRKRNQCAKRNKQRQTRQAIQLKMGKKVFFTLTHCSKKLSGISNRYCYKSNMHGLIFKNACFENVRYQSSIITNCNFNGANLTGVDFCNSNMKKSTFKNARLKDVCFINCNLSGTDFDGAVFENVVFVCTGIEKAKKLCHELDYKVYRTYPKIMLEEETQKKLLQLAKYQSLYIPHILHISKSKLNLWTIKILFDCYGQDVFRALVALNTCKDKRHFFTLHSYRMHIEKYLKI